MKLRIVGIVLALLAVLGILQLQTAEQASFAAVPVAGGEYQSVPLPDTVEALSGTVGSYGQVSHKVDASGKLFVAFGNLNPANSNQTFAELHSYSQAGALLDTWYVNPSPEFKIDSIDITYSCPDIKVALTTHSYVGTRRRQVEESLIPGVFNCGPGGQAAQLTKEGGPGAYQPVAQVQSDPVDYDRLQRMIDNSVNNAVTKLERDMPAIVSNAVSNTLTLKGVLTLGNVYKSDGLYARIHETAAQSDLEALGAYGAAKQPTPTPRP